MAIAGNPKKMAQDIADGFIMLSPPMLRPYTPADLKIILTNMGIVARELRGQQIPIEEVMAIKAKNMKLTRLNQAEMVLRNYGRKNRMVL